MLLYMPMIIYQSLWFDKIQIYITWIPNMHSKYYSSDTYLNYKFNWFGWQIICDELSKWKVPRHQISRSLRCILNISPYYNSTGIVFTIHWAWRNHTFDSTDNMVIYCFDSNTLLFVIEQSNQLNSWFEYVSL